MTGFVRLQLLKDVPKTFVQIISASDARILKVLSVIHTIASSVLSPCVIQSKYLFLKQMSVTIKKKGLRQDLEAATLNNDTTIYFPASSNKPNLTYQASPNLSTTHPASQRLTQTFTDSPNLPHTRHVNDDFSTYRRN